MARREVTQYFDDFDNSPLADDEVNVIDFSVNGVHYTMELSSKNKKKFDDAVAPFVEVARRTSAARKPSPSASAARNRRIREWAEQHGVAVSKRGRIASDVIEKYNRANR